MLSYVCAKLGVMDGMLADAATVVAAFASRAAYALSDEVLCGSLVDLQAVISQAMAAMAVLVREADGRDLPHNSGASSATAWSRDLLRISAAEARQLVVLGRLLDDRPVLAAAVAAGEVNAGQALAIGRVLDDVPPDDPDVVDKVETALVGHAGVYEPTILRRLGDRILAHVDPELADRTLRERLDREERRARARREFTISPDGLGGMRLRGRLDVEGAAIIAAAIEPLARPVTGADGPDLRTPGAQRADALVDVCRIALATDELPDNGGTPPQLNVTVDFDALARRVAVGQLDAGALLSPETTRRLACDAQILPVVLGGASVPIDLGRARRLFTGGSRQAVLLRDGGCGFPGCDRPPRWTDIHHIKPWAEGGPTNQDNAVALCSHHHRQIHHGGWTVHMGTDKHPEFLPPAHIDPHQVPLRNPYHQRL